MKAFKAPSQQLVSLPVHLETVHHYIDELLWRQRLGGDVGLDPIARFVRRIKRNMAAARVRERWWLETRFQF
ncbi:hypothetical protein [Bradyrhizobium manausense]|uniref:hypothetical protein n=1 Tax=Bradyrhizobium manausense TaxID=989370 RepID=UPI001BA83101|nr:hypothetical protein [Bradyrhizobium manausense]MBR0722685.1 hypothetical protein [Bradyrhizobium manausense]